MAIVTNGSTGTHITSKWLGGKGEYCDCFSFFYRGWCKHIRKVKDMAVEIKDYIKKTKMKKLPSALKGLNEMFGGTAYTNDNIFAYYSEPEIGKTLKVFEDAVYFTSLGENVLYITTEGLSLIHI